MTGVVGRLSRLVAVAAASLLLAGVAASASAAAPTWSQLNPREQQVLAPLQPEWEKLDAQRKQKWRGIAERYPKMSPTEQQRVQEQMRT